MESKNNNGKLTLVEEINNCLTTGQWEAPTHERREQDTIIGEMSDMMKTLFTLRRQKTTLIEEKIDQLRDIVGEERGMNFLPPGLDDILEAFLGRGITVMRMAGSEEDVFNMLQKDDNLIASLEAEIGILASDIAALEAMISGESYRTVPTNALLGSHQHLFASDFSILGCGCSKHASDPANGRAFQNALARAAEKLHVISLPNSSELLNQFRELMEEFKTEYVVCPTGFIPNLHTENTTMVFFPKDINAKGIYKDENLSSKGDSKTAAKTRKEKANTLFTSMLETGTPYEAPKEEALKEESIVAEADN